MINTEQIVVEICDAIMKVADQYHQHMHGEPEIVVYMDADFYRELIMNAQRYAAVTPTMLDFVERQQILGYQVWRVMRDGSGEKHNNFEVVLLNWRDCLKQNPPPPFPL